MIVKLRRIVPVWITALLALPPGCRDSGGPPPPPSQESGSEAPAVAASRAVREDAADVAPASGELQGEAHLEFEELQQDLGEMMQREERSTDFPFAVVGGAVAISKIDSSCGCTEPELLVDGEEWEIGEPMPEGSRGNIRTKFLSSTTDGQRGATITILSDGTPRAHSLKVRATVRPYFRLTPKQVRFGTIPRGRESSREFTVWGVRPWEVREWLRQPDGMAIEEIGEPEADDGGQLRNFRVTIAADAPSGPFGGEFRADTTLDHDLEVIVNAMVAGRILYLPGDRLSFALVRRGEGRERVLRVRASDPDDRIPAPEFELVDSEYFRFEVEETTPGWEYRVTVSIDPEAPEGRHDGVLRVGFGADPSLEGKEVRLVAIVRG